MIASSDLSRVSEITLGRIPTTSRLWAVGDDTREPPSLSKEASSELILMVGAAVEAAFWLAEWPGTLRVFGADWLNSALCDDGWGELPGSLTGDDI